VLRVERVPVGFPGVVLPPGVPAAQHLVGYRTVAASVMARAGQSAGGLARGLTTLNSRSVHMITRYRWSGRCPRATPGQSR
jgi:hypothetical protein